VHGLRLVRPAAGAAPRHQGPHSHAPHRAQARVARGAPSLLGFAALPAGRSNAALLAESIPHGLLRLRSRIAQICAAYRRPVSRPDSDAGPAPDPSTPQTSRKGSTWAHAPDDVAGHSPPGGAAATRPNRGRAGLSASPSSEAREPRDGANWAGGAWSDGVGAGVGAGSACGLARMLAF
jgi:hypothetical protein